LIVLPALAWLGGVALQLQMPALAPTAWALGVAVAGLGLGGLAWRLRAAPAWRDGLVVLAVAALAWSLTNGRAAGRLAGALDPALEGPDLVVTGVVSGLPRDTPAGQRFLFDVEAATLNGTAATVPARLSVGWFRGIDDEALLAGPGEPVRAGQRWQLTLRLRAPHGLSNPYGFDLELWAFEQGIGAFASVRARPGAVVRKLADEAAAPVERRREAVRDAIDARVADPAAAGVLAALAIGDQAAIERADWELFRTTGVAHLMSISGLHVTMFAWLAALGVGALWRRSEGLMLRLPAPMAARWGGVLLAAGYAVLAGWGVPAQRTVWMLATVALLATLGVRWPAPLVLLAAAVVVTAIDPWAMLMPGFWLSFVAVGLLIVAEPVSGDAKPAATGWRAKLADAVWGGLRTQWRATIGLAPLTLVFFQQLSIVGFAANLVAIPLVTLVVTPLALLGIVLPPLWQAAAAVVQGLSWLLHLLATPVWATWTAAAAPAWAVAAGLAGGAVAVLPLPWRVRLLAVPLMLPLLWPAVPRPAEGTFELVAADVGQGTAVLVRTRHHLLVYDSGPAWSPEADAGTRVLVPLLRGRGETRIDTLVLSHRDADHVGGAAALMAALPVGELLSSLEAGHPLLATGVPHRRCEAGQAWRWDGVDFELLHPTAAEHDTATKPNAVSCVLRVRGALTSALLTGDIEAPQEAALRSRGTDLRAELLLVPHHGSRTSSTRALLEAVQPRLAVAQAAYRSRFGHPAPDVVARYAAAGIPFVRSDRCGALTVAPDGTLQCHRSAARRYWHHPPAEP
jgi:competence protein ComEC